MTSDDIVKRLELRSIEANETIKILSKQLIDISALNNKNISDLSNGSLKSFPFNGDYENIQYSIIRK